MIVQIDVAKYVSKLLEEIYQDCQNTFDGDTYIFARGKVAIEQIDSKNQSLKSILKNIESTEFLNVVENIHIEQDREFKIIRIKIISFLKNVVGLINLTIQKAKTHTANSNTNDLRLYSGIVMISSIVSTTQLVIDQDK